MGKKQYQPIKHSGNWAILVALHKLKQSGIEEVKASDLKSKASSYSRTSFHVNQPGKQYNAWAGHMKLVEKEFVNKRGRDRYSLTKTGEILAASLIEHAECLTPSQPYISQPRVMPQREVLDEGPEDPEKYEDDLQLIRQFLSHDMGPRLQISNTSQKFRADARSRLRATTLSFSFPASLYDIRRTFVIIKNATIPSVRYPDLRPRLIRGLIKHATNLGNNHYNRSKIDSLHRLIKTLELDIRIIKSVSTIRNSPEYLVGDVFGPLLEKMSRDQSIPLSSPPNGIFCSGYGALLVTASKYSQGSIVSEKKLLFEAEKICEEDLSTVGQARLSGLKSSEFLKARKRHKKNVWEILPSARPMAFEIQQSPHHQSSNLDATTCENSIGIMISSKVRRELYDAKLFVNIPENHGGIIFAIDDREGGSNELSLRGICELCALRGVAHFTTTLPSGLGDYALVLPIENLGFAWFPSVLIERKRADDFAASINDGRLKRQVTAMLQLREYVKTITPQFATFMRLVFVIEGRYEDNVANCGHRHVGRCGGPTIKDCQKLESQLSTVFEVVKVNSLEETASFLKSVSDSIGPAQKRLVFQYRSKLHFEDICERVQNQIGSFDVKRTVSVIFNPPKLSKSSHKKNSTKQKTPEGQRKLTDFFSKKKKSNSEKRKAASCNGVSSAKKPKLHPRNLFT